MVRDEQPAVYGVMPAVAHRTPQAAPRGGPGTLGATTIPLPMSPRLPRLDYGGYHGVMGRSQLIPPPDLSPPSIAHLAPVDRVRLWAEIVDEGDRLLYEGFLRRHGDAGTARQAMQQWLDRRADDVAPAKARMLADRVPARRSHGG